MALVDMEPIVVETTGRDDLALVHLVQVSADPAHLVETVDAVDPRYPREHKTVIILSTQLGCPVGCVMCDSGGAFLGNLDAGQILAQVRLVRDRRPGILASRKLKVHFARMGEPALNAAAVLDALERLPAELPCPGLMPCVTTVAPRGARPFFADLLALQRRRYPPGRFQLQLSINSTDPASRARLMPHPLLPLEALGPLTAPFTREGDRKVVLNLALARGVPIDPDTLAALFDPDRFMVKLTPLNPTRRAVATGLQTVLSAAAPGAADQLATALRRHGFDTVVSIGEPEEIAIGSNCGQLVRARALAAPPPRCVVASAAGAAEPR